MKLLQDEPPKYCKLGKKAGNLGISFLFNKGVIMALITRIDNIFLAQLKMYLRLNSVKSQK
jgi:hypothetical protein